MTEINGREYNIKEMERWLIGDSDEAIAWRTNDEHLRNVSEMITAFGSVPGGRAPNLVWSRIKAEKKQLQSVADLEEKQELRAVRLKEVARQDYLKNGGKPEQFEREWVSLEKSLLETGRAGDLLEEDHQERRRKSARTF